MMTSNTDLDTFLDTIRDENNGFYESYVTTPEDKMASYLSPVFHFTRAAKGHPDLKDLPAEAAVQKVDGWIKRKGYRDIEEGWRQELAWCADDDGFDARAAFLTCWDEIRFLPGETWLSAAWHKVGKGNLWQLIQRWPGCASVKYSWFLALASELQQLRGDDPILLPCRSVGECLGVNKETVSTYRQLAIKNGFLKVVKEHQHASREATEFRFDKAQLDEVLQWPSPSFRCLHMPSLSMRHPGTLTGPGGTAVRAFAGTGFFGRHLDRAAFQSRAKPTIAKRVKSRI